MRVKAGSDYVSYVRRVLGAAAASEVPLPVPREVFDGYDLRLFDSVAEMRKEIRRKDAQSGLARLVAGFAWEWTGPDLRYDTAHGRLFVDRGSYFDTKGKENNARLGKVYSDDDLLRFVSNIYAVLLTRGIRGTFVYACDPALREYLREFLPSASCRRLPLRPGEH